MLVCESCNFISYYYPQVELKNNYTIGHLTGVFHRLIIITQNLHVILFR